MEAAMPSSYVIGPHYEKFIKRLIATGRYTNASEVIRDALRHFEDVTRLTPRTIDELRAAIVRSDESGEGIPIDEAFDQIEAMLDSEAPQRKSAA
jgi:antitoxin ParD1/3/4